MKEDEGGDYSLGNEKILECNLQPAWREFAVQEDEEKKLEEDLVFKEEEEENQNWEWGLLIEEWGLIKEVFQNDDRIVCDGEEHWIIHHTITINHVVKQLNTNYTVRPLKEPSTWN